MIQKTIIDTLHKESKSQRVITERDDCLVTVYRVLYQSILNVMLTGRKKLGRKMCTSNRDDRKLENTVKQSRFKHLGELHKEWTEAGVSASRVTTLRHLQEKGYQATSETEFIRSILLGLRRKITGLLLSGPKSSFQMKVNVAFHLEIKVPESGGRVERHRIHVAWSPVWSFQSVMIWAAMSCAGVGPLCFLKSTVNAAIYQDILEHFMLSSADKLYGDADFIFQQDLAWGIDYGVLSRGRDTRPNNAIKATWASIPRRIDAVIHAKWGPTKYWVHIQ